MRIWTPLLALLLLVPLKAQEQDTFKADVNLVNVFVTVTDQQGAPVGNLRKQDFKISKESELPLSIVIAVDTSSSTRKDIRLELEAARQFIHSIVRAQDGVAIYQFSSSVTELTPFTSNV